ncbi:hypothetical protein M9H77_31128 [Catharanthus roseus]|uniref:Uncharacterized protein n=1 Tax=Catharanthus roseus TaxID=4058 RepID=A0ACC0A349_CATRO|nr:hypothetical protein M9H77_31128 [Catharanthus roseus]
MLVRGGQDESDEDDEDDEENEGQKATNVNEEDEQQKMHKQSLKGHLQKSKRSLKKIRVYEDELIMLNTLKTRRFVWGYRVTKGLNIKSDARLLLHLLNLGKHNVFLEAAYVL